MIIQFSSFWRQMLTVLACICISTSSFALTVDADDEHFRYEGRIDFSQPKSPLISWQATTIAVEFSGKELQLGFSGLTGQAYFNLRVDNQTIPVKAVNGWLKPKLALNQGKHYLQLYKRSEASGGSVHFIGIKVADNAKLQKPKPIHYSNRFIFYGDSITVGACNEDGANDQWENLSTHNTALSYGSLVANRLNAEYRNVAISGIGISIGYQAYTVDQVWNRYNADPKSAVADLKQFQPDIVFVNYGENDDSFTTNQKTAFPSDYVPRYLAFLKALRKTYPDSKIVILRGGMYGGKKSVRLIEPWKKVVAEAEKSDGNIYHYVFEHWYHLHPRVADHEKMATELVQWLQKNKWVKPAK